MVSRAPAWEASYCEFFVARERSYMRIAYALLAIASDADLTFPDPVVVPLSTPPEGVAP